MWMSDLHLVVITGLFSLGGVFVGALLTPLTQFCLEKMQERRTGNRAKLLIAGELLHVQTVLRAASKVRHWPPVENGNEFLPASAWHEHRSSLAGNVDDDLWNELVIAYAELDWERARFVLSN